MAKSKSKVKRAISKTRKKAVSKLKKIKAPKLKKAVKNISKVKKTAKKATLKKKLNVPKFEKTKVPDGPKLDMLPPPPPGLLKQKDFKPAFKPSGHELTRLMLNLKKDVAFINDNRKYLTMPMEKAVDVSDARLMAVHDVLDDDHKYDNEVKEIENLMASYEGITKKGWLSERKINETRHYLEAYKLVAEDTRKDVIERIEQIRKQKEVNLKAEKYAKEEAKKSNIIKSLEPKPKGLKVVVKELPPPPEEEISHKELHKHVTQLKDSLGHIKKRESIINKVRENLHNLTHKELHIALGHLKTTKEHLGKVSDIEEHIAAHSSVPHGRKVAAKLDLAKGLLGRHDIDVEKKKAQVNEHIKEVKKKIKEFDNEKKEAEKKETLVKEEASSVLPKMGELKSHLRYVLANRKLLQIPEDRLRKMSSKNLYDLSNKLNVVKQYIGGIEDIEDHLVAESSKPHSVIAEKHLSDARKLIEAHKLDISQEKSLIDGKISLIKDIAKGIAKPVPLPRKEIPVKLPKLKPMLKEKPKKAEKEPKEEPDELEVPIPVFEKPKPGLLKLMAKLRKDLNYVKKNDRILEMSEDTLRSLSSWKLRGMNKSLNWLRHYMEELQDTEEHIAAESSMPQGLMAEKQLEDAKKLMDSYDDLGDKLKELNSKIDVVEGTLAPGKKPAIPVPSKVKAGAPEMPEPEMPLPEPEIPKGPVKKIKIEPKEHIPEAPGMPQPKGKIKPEISMMIYKLKRDLIFTAKNEKFLRMSDEVLKSIAKWRLNGIIKNLQLMRDKLESMEDIEVELAAEGSIKQPEAVEKQLEDAKELMGIYNLNIAKKLKEVKSRIGFIREQLTPTLEMPVMEAAKVPKMKTLEEEFKPMPKAKLPKPAMPEMEMPKGMPMPPPGVPVFKPSPSELVVLISRIKTDLNYIAKYEKLLHVREEHITSLSHKKIDNISDKLKSERKYLDDLEEIENRVGLYEKIPNKGWLSTKKIAEARALLEAYKSHHVGMTRKMVVNRLDILKGRKQAVESERTNLAKVAASERMGHITGEAKALKEVEEHVKFREKSEAEELLADLQHLRTMKQAEEYKKKIPGVPTHTVVRIKPSIPIKPALERTEIDSRKEISSAIESLKTGRPPVENKVEYIIHRINEARDALIDLDVQTAKEIYLEAHSIYLALRPLEQYRVYESLTSLYEERKSAEKILS